MHLSRKSVIQLVRKGHLISVVQSWIVINPPCPILTTPPQIFPSQENASLRVTATASGRPLKSSGGPFSHLSHLRSCASKSAGNSPAKSPEGGPCRLFHDVAAAPPAGSLSLHAGGVMLDEAVRGQLRALLADKARLLGENESLLRENNGLQVRRRAVQDPAAGLCVQVSFLERVDG